MTKRKTQMVLVRNRPDSLVPKPPIGLFRPREQRFYNWGGRDERGKPIAENKEWEVPNDSVHQRMIIKGDLIRVVKASKPPKTTKPKRAEKPVEDDKK